MKITIFGLSITSSWGNGHATTWRSLVKGLNKLGHTVTFLERNVPWYSANRDLPEPDYCTVILYDSLKQLNELIRFVEDADVVIVGSYVPDGITVGEFVLRFEQGLKLFYDIDTPVTLASLRNNDCEYLTRDLIREYNIYLSFSAGKCLEIFEQEFGSPSARHLYCSVDPDLYYPVDNTPKWDLGYIGTYSEDRQVPLNKMLIESAERWKDGKFAVAGPLYPPAIIWPDNVERVEHVPPHLHTSFYSLQRYTLNITRKDMIRMGFSPSVRLFEAGACGIPVISDWWEGLETIFRPGREILISSSSEDTLRYLKEIPEEERRKIGTRAREIVLKHHTGLQRATELEEYILKASSKRKKDILHDQNYNPVFGHFESM